MSEWKMKRFWKQADIAEAEEGFTVALDGRPIKTPAKQGLIVPTKALAESIAAEWDAQEGEVDPESMPFTRLSNSALDKVARQHEAVAQIIAEYGGSDLLCYRAHSPEELVQRQAEAWDRLLDWAQTDLSVRLDTQSGMMPIPQPETSQQEIRRRTAELDPFALTALHELVSLSGSWVLGYAVLTGHESPDTAWTTALVDEIWQEEQWGADEEAGEARAVKQNAFVTAYRFADLSRTS
ncbi:ATPase [Aliishimia ponticola]|uniref:ATPase n=1 Tax=Aliishimia ponticola TaxID=2499833 RepID=A0A4S4N808_9RHOB|nr:ATP12 family protein [Aliishimia ponticola]THH34467.1 ATPase [Aliishimia ponticola]